MPRCARTSISVPHSAEAVGKLMPTAEVLEGCVDRAASRARDRVCTLPSALAVARCSLSTRISNPRQAEFGGQFPTRVARRHNRGNPNKDCERAQDGFRRHLDGGEPPIAKLLRLAPSIRGYGQQFRKC